MDDAKYTAALAKGHGIIEETVDLLDLWEPGMSAPELAKIAIGNGILRRATAKRAQDLVIRVFAPRYLVDNARPAQQLKTLMDAGASQANLEQLVFVYTARANAVLHDFVCEVYWGKYSAGSSHIATDDARHFLEGAYNLGRLPMRWSEKMMARVAQGLYGCLGDFKLSENARKSNRKILPFSINALTAVYLTHDLHFSGYSDNAILEHPDWRLFGLQKMEVLRELQRVSRDHFIPQFSGELLRISWKHKSMEEAIRAIARSEF